MSTFLNISAPLRASIREISWGVVTTTAPTKKIIKNTYGMRFLP